MTVAVPSWLLALGIPESCISHDTAAGTTRRFVIQKEPGDQIWRVAVDQCWMREQVGVQRVDYLFFAQSASGRRLVLLVELKGGHFGEALDQIAQTLELLCKRSANQGIHLGTHRQSPGHDAISDTGIRAYVVLSNGNSIRQRKAAVERIRRQYGVHVIAHTQQLRVIGVDKLPVR